MRALSTSQLSKFLSVTKRTVQRRANKEQWQFDTERGLGGERRLYIFACLPASVRQKVVASIIEKHEKQGIEYSRTGKIAHVDTVFDMKDTPFIVLDKYDAANWVTQHTFAHEVDVTELNKEYVKQGVLIMAKLYVLHFNVGKVKGFDDFCHLYNEQQITLCDSIYRVLPSVSRISLIRWEKQLANSNRPTFIWQDPNSKKNTTLRVLLDRDILQMAHELLMISPNIGARRLRQHFTTVFGARKMPTEFEFSLWLQQNYR